jgi:hypothetical protein
VDREGGLRNYWLPASYCMLEVSGTWEMKQKKEPPLSSLTASTQQQPVPTSRLTQAFAILWGLSTLALAIGLAANDGTAQGVGALLGLIYILVLIGWLARSKPAAADLPDCRPIVGFLPNYWAMLAFIVALTALLTALTSGLLGNGWHMLVLSILLSLAIIVAWRKRLTRKLILAGVVTAVVLLGVEHLLSDDWGNGLITSVGAGLMAVAGALLLDHTRLTHVRLLEGDYLAAGKSFLWGCVLAIPPALLNALSMRQAPPSEFDLMFDQWWKALYALQPGILEEVWARLLLTTLLYALLRPLSAQRPRRAVVGAMLIAATIHGLAHFPTSLNSPMEAIYVTLMYGIPLALVYVKRDLEQAIAYHFFIDFVRFAAYVVV